MAPHRAVDGVDDVDAGVGGLDGRVLVVDPVVRGQVGLDAGDIFGLTLVKL